MEQKSNVQNDEVNKKRQKKEISDTKICLILYGLTFLMMAVLGSVLSVSYILDETGTVANAAFLAGYNWNDWVNSTGGYFYKYGQVIFYTPIFKLFSNPYLIYKLMLIVNGALVAFIPVISYKILRKHLGQENKAKCAIMSLCLAVIPATILYSLFARADVILIAFAWITLYFIYECMEAQTTKKRAILSSLIALSSVYMYMCHSRGIVFVIAVFMVLFMIRFVMKDKHILFSAYLINVVVWLFVDKRLTAFFKNSIWGSGNKKNTIESMNYEKYLNVFTKDGLETVVKNVTGWLFNTFLGTMGLAILGLFFAFVIIVYYFSKKKGLEKKEVVLGMYSVLTYLGTLAMGILFFFGSNYKFITGEKVKRADRFLYSRYVAPAYAILVFIALFYLFFKNDTFGLKTKISALIFGGVLILYCRTWIGNFANGIEYSWRNTIDSALFFNMNRYGNDANKYTNVSRALLLAAVFAFIVLLVLIVISKMGKKYWTPALIVLGLILLTSSAVNYVKLRYSTDVRPMLTAAPPITQMEDVLEHTELDDVYKQVYLDKTISRKKMYQLAIPECVVHVNKSLSADEVDNMFIIVKNYIINDKWMDEDCYLFADYDLENTQTTVIVKGEKLKEKLELQGYELVEIPEDYTNNQVSKSGIPFLKAVKMSFDYQMKSFQ